MNVPTCLDKPNGRCGSRRDVHKVHPLRLDHKISTEIIKKKHVFLQKKKNKNTLKNTLKKLEKIGI